MPRRPRIGRDIAPDDPAVADFLAASIAALPATDPWLDPRAHALNAAYFDGRLTWRTIHWTHTFRRKYADCTPALGRIRLSIRALELPDPVIDYLLVHELAHLEVPGHGPAFWALVRRYPDTDRARGYLYHQDLLHRHMPTNQRGLADLLLVARDYLHLDDWTTGYLDAYADLLLTQSQPPPPNP